MISLFTHDPLKEQAGAEIQFVGFNSHVYPACALTIDAENIHPAGG
jgi:hypothetical protein